MGIALVRKFLLRIPMNARALRLAIALGMVGCLLASIFCVRNYFAHRDSSSEMVEEIIRNGGSVYWNDRSWRSSTGGRNAIVHPLNPIPFLFGPKAFVGIDSVELKGSLGDEFVKRNRESLRRLKGLRLTNASVTTAGLERLSEGSELQSLMLTSSPKDQSILTAAKRFQQLEFIQLFETSLPAESMRSLQEIPGLRSLSFVREKRLGRESISVISTCNQVRHLEVMDCGLADRDFRELAAIQSLHAIHFSPTLDITEHTLSLLLNHKNLEIVWIDGSGVTDAMLKAVKVQGVRELKIHSDFISKEGVWTILQWPEVKRLHVSSALLDATVLSEAISFQSIEYLKLELPGKQNDYRAAIAAFKSQNPRCEVEID